MAFHTNLPIYKKASELLALALLIHEQMRRGLKRTLGDKIVSHCTEMVDSMAMANASRNAERAGYLRNILMHIRAATVLLRAGLELRAVSVSAWTSSVEMLDSIGKQANGWLKKTVPAA